MEPYLIKLMRGRRIWQEDYNMGPKVIYVDKDRLYPKFGLSLPATNTALVRNDLPVYIQNFVREHELYHLRDNTKYWLWREIKANAYAASQNPLGFIGCCIYSLAPYRLKYYWSRFKKEE